MPNPPVCYYYQAGCCRNGNECTFTHPKIRCRTFASDGWCPYGYNCRFWHDPSVKLGVVNLIKKPCQFYANNQCKYGDKCNFSHDINAQNNSGITLEEYRATKTVTGVHINIEAQESTTTEMSHGKQDGISDASLTSVVKSNLTTTSSSTCLNKNNRSCVRPPFQKYASVNAIDFQGASKAEICDLNHSELKRLKKQFPPDKLHEVKSNENYHMFCVRFSSTDPDWVYDVREIVLNILIPQMYPKEQLQISVVMQEHLPVILVDHLNKAIGSWVRCKHQCMERMNRLELYLRPLLLWLDRNLEELFTEGLRKYKAFIENGNLDPDLSSLLTKNNADVISHCQSSNKDNDRNSLSSYNNATGSTPVVLDREILEDLKSFSLNSYSDSNLSVVESDKTLFESEIASRSRAYNNFLTHSDEGIVPKICNLTKENDFPTDSLLDHDSMIGLIPSVIPKDESEQTHNGDRNSHNGDQLSIGSDNSVSSQTSESVLEYSSTDENENDPGSECEVVGDPQVSCGNLLSSSSLTTPGTQKLLMSGLRLLGKAGTYIQRRLSVSLHCTRCRLSFQWLFTFHGARAMNNFNDPNTACRLLRSLPPYTTHCARCHQKLTLLFQSSLAHAFDNNIGTLHLDGCIADDVPPKQSDGIILCTGCFNSVRVTGLDFDCPLTRRCFNCHSLTGLEFSKFQLELLKQPSNSKSVKIDGTNQDSSSQISRRMRRTMNSAQNTLIQDGSPLPAYGSCKHYRKSYRWLRFPCCGRLEPCDVCHDNSAVDGHEMELATRMICGFCSKEQPFSTNKPCVRCDKMLSGTRSSHWEGGKGCRNQVTMSRKDSRKYSHVNKVISKKKTKQSK
ncbi:unnamed protein product [Schistosoma intercalatum]|nr:unnamed protein product [Schistosoma intercalatum]